MHIQLKTLRDVAVGDEVTISYIDENRPRSARRDNLASSYHFNCTCSRCTEEAESGSAKYSYSRSVNNHARKGAKKRELQAGKKKADASAAAASEAQVPAAAAAVNLPPAEPAAAEKEKQVAQEKTEPPAP